MAHGVCRGSACSAPGLRPRSSISARSWRACGLPRAAGRSGNITCSGTSGASTGELMRQLIVIGAPISISFLLEYGLFGAAGLLMGLISTTALAAHQIALQIAAILFMVPFGIGMAATVRVGHAVGRSDAGGGPARGLCRDAARHRARRRPDAGRDRRPLRHRADLPRREHATPTAELSATLLLVGATFFIADGIQTIAAGALRGMNDTRVPLLFADPQLLADRLPAAPAGSASGRRRRGRRLDRPVGRDRGLCHPSAVALPPAGEQARIPMTVSRSHGRDSRRPAAPGCRLNAIHSLAAIDASRAHALLASISEADGRFHDIIGRPVLFVSQSLQLSRAAEDA